MKQEVLKLFEFFKILENLALEKRATILSDGSFESVAGHCFSTAMLVVTLKPYIEKNFDYTKALEMALVHDLGESLAGDISLHEQTTKIKEQKQIQEEKAVRKMMLLLNNESAGNINSLWNEYEQRESKEARLIKLLDTFDAHITVLNRNDIDYPSQYGGGQFYYDLYANYHPNKKLNVEGEIFNLIETVLRENLTSQMDKNGIKYNLKK